MGSTKPKHSHSDRDRIWTPDLLAIELIKRVPIDGGDSLCDPCYGTGVFYENFSQHPNFHGVLGEREWFEIDKKKDFLAAQQKWDWCITNIPFSRPSEFIFKMADCSKKGFGILCLSNSMTVSRLEKLKKLYGFYPHSITEIYVRSWGFGYKTCFYVFTKTPKDNLTSIIV